MDGDFDDETTLTITQAEKPELVGGKLATEQWHVSCSDTSQESYTIRYLAPDEVTEDYSVFVRTNDGWQKVSSTAFGSYLVFTVASPEVDVAVVHALSVWLQYAIVFAVILLVLLVLFGISKSRRGKQKRTPTPAHNAEAPKANPPHRPAKKKKRIILLVIAVLAIAVVCALVYVKFGAAADAYELLKDFAEQPENAMTLSMSVQLDDTIVNTEMDVTRTQVEGHEAACIQSSGISLYYANGAVIMENGKAFQVSDLHPDYSLLPAQTAQLFGAVAFTTSRSDEGVVSQLTAEGENANRLLKVLLPQQAEHLSDTQKITVQLTSSGNKIRSIRFFSEGTLMDTDKTVYTLTAELKPKSIDENFTIPDAVKETISSGNTEGEISISEDLFRLLSAWTTMSQEGSFAADVQLSVECGPISLSESMKYGQALAEGNKVSFVRKDDLAVYFAQETFCDQNGVLLTEQDSALIDRARLLEVLKQICLNGEFDCTDTGNSTWLYKLTLDENAMKTIAYAAAPEMQSMPVTLSSGSVQLTVSDGVTKEIECLCTGGLEGLAEAAPALFVPNRTRGELPRYPRLADFQSAV